MYKHYIKHFFDRFIAAIILALLLPLLILIIVVLFFSTNETPFFLQMRSGKNGNTFKIIKFRTMHDSFDSCGNLLPDLIRLHKIGLFLRKTSLDELPQLINVIRGEMSFVGPRPLLPEYLPLYNPNQTRRHEVKPGITGLAQVNGRNSISWEEKFRMDVWYVENISFRLDVKIIGKTIFKLLSLRNLQQETMVIPKFQNR